jgi:hypothetical protein
MKWVKVREKIAALVAIVLIFLLIVVGSVVFGWNIPIVRDVARMLGLTE